VLHRCGQYKAASIAAAEPIAIAFVAREREDHSDARKDALTSDDVAYGRQHSSFEIRGKGALLSTKH
jgi:hypothetical protein